MKRVLLAFLVAAAAVSVSAQANGFIKNGATLNWKASTGDNGTMAVSNVSGANFEVAQSNVNNKAAGLQKLYGAILDGGKKVVLLNVGNWKEVWEGTATADGVNGNIITSGQNFTFSISTGAPEVSTAPFIAGKTLKWKTNANGGQNGNMKVTAVDGATFKLEQTNVKNKGAGVTKLDGEVKDGKFFIYNRQWRETWEGTLSGKTVKGKINNSWTFEIQ
jgi:hypothetical protein